MFRTEVARCYAVIRRKDGTVSWNAEFVPDLIGIAFGAFADRSMPPSTESPWQTTLHRRTIFDHELDRFGYQVELIEGKVTVRR